MLMAKTYSVTLLACVIFVFVGCSLGGEDLLPHHVYLSLTGNSGSMQITFTTAYMPTTPMVQYWPVIKKQAIVSLIGKNNTFTFVSPSTTIDYITSFTMTNLEEGTYYSYVVYGEANQPTTASQMFTFRSLPADDTVINIGFFGDLGTNGTSLLYNGPGNLASYAHNFDFIVHNGDMAYDLGSFNGHNGRDFLNNIESVSATTPYVVTPGNHEFKTPFDVAYYSNWFRGQTLLGQTSNSSNPVMWYSFDVSPKLHVIAISTEVYCEDQENMIAQYNWLVGDLKEVRNRDEQPWIVMFGHRNIYDGFYGAYHSRIMRHGVQCTDPSLTNCNLTQICDSKINCAYSIEKLLIEYHVDILLAGHVHTYSRMLPISDDNTYETQDRFVYVNPQHPVYVISGAAGIDAGILPPSGTDSPKGIFDPVVFSDTGNSFSHMQVFNSTHLFLQQISVVTANVTDEFWIVKDTTKGPWKERLPFVIIPLPEAQCD